MAHKWAYDYDNIELMHEFMNACANAGISGSRLVIDLTGNTSLAEAHYLKGVVLSRIDQKKPPFKRSENVRLKSSVNYRVFSTNRVDYSTRELSPDASKEVHEIVRVFYEDDGKWSLIFRDDQQFHYPADVFEKTDEKADALPKPRREPVYIEGGYDSDGE